MRREATTSSSTRAREALVKVTGSALVALLSLGFSPPATAQTGDRGVSGEWMFLGGVDAQQAARAGNPVRIDGSELVLSDGKTGRELARIPANPQTLYTRAFAQSEESAWTGTAPRTRPSRSTCGSSYIAIRDATQQDMYQFKTGFSVDARAVHFTWQVEIVASRMRDYTYTQDFSGPLSRSRTWTSDWRNDYSEITRYLSDDGSVEVRHVARVTLARVLLADGRVCIAGQPVASAVVR